MLAGSSAQKKDPPLAVFSLDDERIYIEDGLTIKLFNRIDYKFFKTIGGEGQGPGEFQGFATPQILSEHIFDFQVPYID